MLGTGGRYAAPPDFRMTSIPSLMVILVSKGIIATLQQSAKRLRGMQNLRLLTKRTQRQRNLWVSGGNSLG